MPEPSALLTALLLAGRTVAVTRMGGEVETGPVLSDQTPPPGCLHYRRPDGTRGVSNLLHVTLVDESVNPELKARMTAVWDTLPVEMRAAFRPLKTAVLDAINDNSLDEVRLLIEGAQVPAEYADAKAALVQLLA